MASTPAPTEVHPSPPYGVGQVITLHQVSERGVDYSSLIKLKICRLHQPWTLSCGMVVEILDQPSEAAASSVKPSPQTAFLKLYDWRFAHQLRDDQGVDPWSQKSETEYTKFVLSGDVDDFLQQLHADDSFPDETEDDWEAGQNEAFLASQSLRMYRAETAAYARLAEFQGELVPRLLAAAVLDAAPDGVEGRHRQHFQVRAILLQYVQGISLSKLDAHVPSSGWQDAVDQALRIIHVVGDNGILNEDVRPDNFMVRLPDTGEQKYQVYMLDFGQSRLRGQNMSDFEWGRAKWRQDEEGAIGHVMKHRLSKLGAEISYQPSQRYIEFAEKEGEQ